MDKKIRNNLTDEQKFLIKHLYVRENQTPEQIMYHPDLVRENGKPCQKRTVDYWINRFVNTGQMKTKNRSGRPKKLNSIQEKKILDYVQKNPKKNYAYIRHRFMFHHCSRLTINRVGLRNGLSNLIFF